MNYGEFAREVFKGIGARIDGKTLTFAVAWANFENTSATNNPFATTQPWSNSTEFNSVGVRNYESVEDGIGATVHTLNYGQYDYLREVLRNVHSTPREMIGALNASPWGSYVSIELFEEVEKNYTAYNKEVPGSVSVVAPTPAPTLPIPESPVPTPEESETVVDNETVETPEVDTLESRLAKLAEANAAPAATESEVSPTNFTEN